MKGQSVRNVIRTSGRPSRRPNASGKTAIRNPQNALPTSPIKILAGAQLKLRKPTAAAAKDQGSIATNVSPPAPIMRASAAPVAAAVIPAIPSIPSMKLNALVSPTTQIIVSGHPSTPNSMIPKRPRSTRSTGPKKPTAMAAAPTWTRSRVRVESGRMSSRQLIAATANAGSSSIASCGPLLGSRIAMIIAAIVVTATIARPPPRGVGRAWLLRELG